MFTDSLLGTVLAIAFVILLMTVFSSVHKADLRRSEDRLSGDRSRAKVPNWLAIGLAVMLGASGCDQPTEPPVADGSWAVRPAGGAIGTPYVGQDVVVAAASLPSRVFAVERSSGKVLWETRLIAPFDQQEPMELLQNVEVRGAGDLVVVAWGWIHALDQRTGEVVWSLTPNDDRPGRWIVPAGDELIGVGRDLYVIDPERGDVLSRIDVGTTPFAPVYDEGVLYFGGLSETDGSGVEPIATAVDIGAGEVLWRRSVGAATEPWNLRRLHRGDLTDELFVVGGGSGEVFGLNRTTGESRWVSEPGPPFHQPWERLVRVISDVAVVSGTSGVVEGLDITTGERQWFDASFPASARKIGAAGELALVVNGVIRAFDAEGRMLWRFGRETATIDSADPIFLNTTPIVRDGFLYATSPTSGLIAVRFEPTP